MFNIGSGELALIAVVALLILGPKRLPELARGIGKFMREFRRQTDEVRGVVEREFYKMDQDLPHAPPPPRIAPSPDAVAVGTAPEPGSSEHPHGSSEHPHGSSEHPHGSSEHTQPGSSEHPQSAPAPGTTGTSTRPSPDGFLPPVTDDVHSQVMKGAAPSEPAPAPAPRRTRSADHPMAEAEHPDEVKMSLMEHLAELRTRLVTRFTLAVLVLGARLAPLRARASTAC